MPTPTNVSIPSHQLPAVSDAVGKSCIYLVDCLISLPPSHTHTEKARKAAELQAKIKNTLAGKPSLLSAVTSTM